MREVKRRILKGFLSGRQNVISATKTRKYDKRTGYATLPLSSLSGAGNCAGDVAISVFGLE